MGRRAGLTHELLHHKRPELFPLIDGLAGPHLEKHTDERRGLWGVVHGELRNNEEQFTALEQTFQSLVNAPGDVLLERLRLHDILLWSKASKKWPHAVKKGRSTAERARWLDSKVV